MPAELRKSGIEILGDIPWGSHFCNFYETKDDLLELLVPYFKAGLENNEYCLWIVDKPTTTKDALRALKKNVPHFQQYFEKKSIEILPYMEWFMATGKFDAKQINNAWIQKLDEALARGYDGLRINGNETWLERKGWNDFMKYEQGLNGILKNRRIIGLCTYPLSHIDGGMVLDVAHTHESVIAKRSGQWEILERPEIKKLKAELQQRSDELEHRVAERTAELAKLIEQLKTEISERLKAEERLKRQVEFSNEIINTIPIMAWSILPDGTLEFVNESWFNYSGLSLSDALEGPAAMIHPDDLQQTMEKWAIHSSTGTAYEDEMRVKRADGQYRWFMMRTAPLRDKHGKVYKWYGVSIDIEDSKRSQDELRLAYQRLSYHVDNTPLAVIEFDKDLFITRWSDQAEKIFGWKAPEVLGKNIYDPEFPIIYKEDKPQVDNIVSELMHGFVDRNFSLNRNYTKDEKVIYCEWYNSVLRDEHGSVITILSLVHNVTERKKAEETLCQSYEQIRSLSKHLGIIREEERKYISREIHDELGQYLTVLKMDVGLLNKKIHVTDETVQGKLKGLSGIIDNIVYSMRRIALELRPSLLDDLGLAAAIGWHVEEFQKQSGIKTYFREPEDELDLPEPVKTHLFRILQESLTNIVRHSKASEVKINLVAEDHELTLTIADNGIGFNPEKINQEIKFGILGMKERTAIIKGNYDIQSKSGNGTRITVTVPLQTKHIHDADTHYR